MRVTLGSTSARWSQPSSGRTRWYAVLRRDGCATAWPLPNHKRPDTLLDPHLPHWLSVRPCIDLADVGKRVDHRSRPLSAKTLARMERGFREYGGQWLMSYYGTGVGQSLDMPLRTITCTDRFALVTMRQRHAHLRMLTPEELKLAQGFPVRYVIDRYSDGTAVPKRQLRGADDGDAAGARERAGRMTDGTNHENAEKKGLTLSP